MVSISGQTETNPEDKQTAAITPSPKAAAVPREQDKLHQIIQESNMQTLIKPK